MDYQMCVYILQFFLSFFFWKGDGDGGGGGVVTSVNPQPVLCFRFIFLKV